MAPEVAAATLMCSTMKSELHSRPLFSGPEVPFGVRVLVSLPAKPKKAPLGPPAVPRLS